MRNLLSSVALAAGMAFTFPAAADDLYQIYQKALETDPRLLQAQANRQAAFDNIGVSRGALLPQISASASYDWNNSNRDFRDQDGPNATIGFSQSIFDRNNWVNLNIAEKAASQSDVLYQVAIQDLIVRVANAYFAVLLAQDVLEFTRAEKAAIERQLEQTKQRFAVGLTAITDVHEAQAEFDQVLADEIVALNDLENSFEGLREITGIYHKQINILNTDRFAPTQPEPLNSDAWQETANERNLDILSQKLAVDIALENIENAKGDRLPDISFDVAYNSNNTDNDVTGVSSYDDIFAGVSVSVPLYTGGTISSNIKSQRSQYVSASEGLNQTYRATMRNVINQYNNVRASISAVRAFEQTVVSRESSLQATEAGFEVGTRTIVDVLDSTRNLFSAKSQLSSARYNYILSVLALKRAAGTLAEDDVVLINKGLQP